MALVIRPYVQRMRACMRACVRACGWWESIPKSLCERAQPREASKLDGIERAKSIGRAASVLAVVVVLAVVAEPTQLISQLELVLVTISRRTSPAALVKAERQVA